LRQSRAAQPAVNSARRAPSPHENHRSQRPCIWLAPKGAFSNQLAAARSSPNHQPALKARFNAPVHRQSHTDWCRHEVVPRLRDWGLGVRLESSPQRAAYERRAFSAKQMR
jgi:hypothetical protein